MASKRKEIESMVLSSTPKKQQFEKELECHCNVEIIVDFLKKYCTPEKKQVVRSLGFGSLLQLKCISIRGNMCKKMLDSFDPEECYLTVHDKKILLKPFHVQHILGFKDAGIDVTAIGVDSESDENLARYVNLTLEDMVDRLKLVEASSKEFKRLLVLLLMTALFAPTSTRKPRKNWINIVIDVDHLYHINWAKFIFDNLVQGALNFKENRTRPIRGCILFWMILFCEYSVNHDLNEISRENVPRLAVWDDTKTRCLHRYIMFKLDGLQGYDTKQLMVKIEDFKQILKGEDKWQNENENRLVAIERTSEKIRGDIQDIKNQLNSLTHLILKISTRCDLILKSSKTTNARSSFCPIEDNCEAVHLQDGGAKQYDGNLHENKNNEGENDGEAANDYSMGRINNCTNR